MFGVKLRKMEEPVGHNPCWLSVLETGLHVVCASEGCPLLARLTTKDHIDLNSII